MANRSVTVTLQAQVAGFVNGMRTAQASVNQLTAATDQAAQRRQALDGLGTTAGKVGLVAAAGLGAAVMAAANFDKAMSGVQAATRESASGMESLRAAALKAGQDTAFSATEAAGGIEALAKAGVSTRDILGGGLTGALDLAAAGEIGVAEAAEQAATAMTQFGLSGSEVPHIADLLAAGAGKAQGEVSDMGAALNQAGLVANSMGLSIEETTGSLAAFASAGLIGSDAGTSLKSMLQRLANPSKEAADQMSALGVNAYDAQGNFVGLDGIAGQLRGSMKNLSSEQRDAAMATIFGSDAVRAANVLYSEGAKGITNWTKQVDDQGFAAETAATKLDNLRGDLEALGGAFETALIGTGSGAQGPLREVVQDITAVVNAYNDLPQAAQSSVAGMLAATAVLGGGAFLGAKVIQGIAETRASLQTLGVQAGTTRAMLANLGKGIAFGAVLIGLSQIDEAFDKLKNSDLEGSTLDRSLKALSQGRVEGTVFDTYGKSLNEFTKDLELLNGGALNNVNETLGDLIPGDDSWDEAERRISQIDQALAGLVESGQQGQASRIFDEFAAAAERGGHSVDDVRDKFEQYGTALANVDGNAFMGVFDGIADAVESGARANEQHARSAESDARAIQQQTDAMRDARSEAIRAASAQINYQASIDDARASLRQNGRALNISTEAGRANRSALIGMAAAWNDQSDAAKNANGAQRRAIGTFVDVAVSMGMGEKAARRYANRLFEIPTKVKTDVDADNRSANGKITDTKRKAEDLDKTRPNPKLDADERAALHSISDVLGRLNFLDRARATPTVTANTGSAMANINAVLSRMSQIQNKSVTITTFHRTVGRQGIGDQTVNSASGGYILGPGTKTSDSIPANLSTGEYVVKAAAVDKYGVGMMHRINAMNFAAGGSVGNRGGGGGGGNDEKNKERHRRHLNKELTKAREELEKHSDHLKNIRESSKEFQKTVAANFKSDTFGENFTLQGAISSLGSDAKRARQFRRAGLNAKELGLSGDVFRSLVESGNTAVFQDIDSRKDVRRLEAAWRQRNQATQGLTFGIFEGPAARQQREVQHLRNTIERLNRTLKHVRGDVRDGAREGTEGHRKGERRHRQNTARRAVAP